MTVCAAISYIFPIPGSQLWLGVKVLLNYYWIGSPISGQFQEALIKSLLEEKEQAWVVRQFIITVAPISQLSPWKAQPAVSKPVSCLLHTRLVMFWLGAAESRNEQPWLYLYQWNMGRAKHFLCLPFSFSVLLPLTSSLSHSFHKCLVRTHSRGAYTILTMRIQPNQGTHLTF